MGDVTYKLAAAKLAFGSLVLARVEDVGQANAASGVAQYVLMKLWLAISQWSSML